MEDGEIVDNESGPEMFPAVKMGEESWDKRWTISTSKTGAMYFNCIENKCSIWLSDFRKTFNWRREKSSKAENELYYYFNPEIKVSVWEHDFLRMQAICKTLSTPISESGPISPEGAIPIAESPKTDPRQELVKKMARTFKRKVAKIKVKISEAIMQAWMTNWLEKDDAKRTDMRFYDLFVPKLGHEIIKSRRANKKALELLLDKKIKSKPTEDKHHKLPKDRIVKLLTNRLKQLKLAGAIACCYDQARRSKKPNNQ